MGCSVTGCRAAAWVLAGGVSLGVYPVSRTTWRCVGSASWGRPLLVPARASSSSRSPARAGAGAGPQRRARRRAWPQATAGLVAPGVEAQVVVRAVQGDGRQQLEGLGAASHQLGGPGARWQARPCRPTGSAAACRPGRCPGRSPPAAGRRPWHRPRRRPRRGRLPPSASW